jgi:hypothetical protein
MSLPDGETCQRPRGVLSRGVRHWTDGPRRGVSGVDELVFIGSGPEHAGAVSAPRGCAHHVWDGQAIEFLPSLPVYHPITFASL